MAGILLIGLLLCFSQQNWKMAVKPPLGTNQGHNTSSGTRDRRQIVTGLPT